MNSLATRRDVGVVCEAAKSTIEEMPKLESLLFFRQEPVKGRPEWGDTLDRFVGVHARARK